MEMYGRESETAEVVERLRVRRLVTLVGPGGIGKTALARSAADEIATDFANGAVRVDLTRVDSDEGVFEAFAGQLGFADFGSMIDSPQEQPVLLLIDNCEHVLDAAAEATQRLLDACRMPTILATSRSPLELPDESVVTVTSLPTPLPGFADSDSPAMRLLRARARDNGVELSDDDLTVAAEVVRRLDGVPLAIEIAAARLRSSTLAGLLGEIDRAPHALARRRFRGQASHRSVGEVVDWSYRLLEPVEQGAFVHLGVFSGPFDSELGRIVSGVERDDWDSVLDGLVASSLVVVDRTSETPHFRLLHPVRAVASDLLTRSGDATETRSRLVDAIAARALEAARGGADGWRESFLHDLLAMYDDAAASIRWALQYDADGDRALALMAVLWGVLHNAHSDEIGQLGEEVLIRWPDPSQRRWANAAATVATCRFLRGDLDGAIELAESALGHDPRRGPAPVLLHRVIAQSRRAAGDADGARDSFRLAANLAGELGAHGLAMEMRADTGLAVVECGDVPDGLAIVERSIDEAIERDAPINRVWGRSARAAILLRVDGAAAMPEIEAAVAEARSARYPAGIAFTLRTLAGAHLLADDAPASATAALELLESLLGRGGLDEMRVVLDVAAELARRSGDRSWRDLVATARALPITSFVTPVEPEYVPADHGGGRVLSLRDAYLACRSLLTPIAAGEFAVADADPARPGDSDERDDESIDSETDRPDDDGASAEMVDEGEVWRITFAGTTIRVKASKGVNDLAVLLASPGREVSAADLAGVTTVGESEDELLDAEARRSYEDRVRELQVEIDEADRDHDLARAERARIELDTIVDHLTAALGLGGRSRRTTGNVERARSAVTQRIRASIKRLDELHPELGAHLLAFVSTGIYCSYAARSGTTWSVRR